MRIDPNKGATIRAYEPLEESVRREAQEYYGDAFGKHSFSGNEANRFFLNLAGAQFADLSGVSGLAHRGDGRTLASLDYDRDGWLDIAAVNTNAPALQLWRNHIGELDTPTPRKAIALEFEGGNHGASPAPGLSNRDGYGARITVEAGGQTLLREHHCGEGVFSQNSARMLVGIGTAAQADRVTVRWPSGNRHTVEDIPAGTLLKLRETPTGTTAQRLAY